MTNTTLFINEQEKENARALTQSFARADVKSRAYINALGAEVCMQYLQDNDIVSDRVYNLHNIRKILEEFDISDIMLSNIHIDVRVVYDDTKIFIPKSHFDYNLTPDIYVVMRVQRDHSNMEFLGFFEPKMINHNNTNGEYFFIEKEKLSSPVDLKSYIENYSGNTSSGVSEQDAENAEYLIIAMADNNVSDEDKKQLISYLKNSAELRDKFTEFENFEMLAYHAVSSIDVDSNPDKSEEMDLDDATINGLDTDTVEDIELSNALNSDENTDDEISTDEIFNIVEDNSGNQANEDDGNAIGDAIKGTAVLGAEVAGAVIASAALSGAAEGAEIAKDAVVAASGVSELVGNTVDSISDSFTGHEHIGENIETDEVNKEVKDEIQSSLDTLFNEEEEMVESDKIAVQDIESEELNSAEADNNIENKQEDAVDQNLPEESVNAEEISVDLFEEPISVDSDISLDAEVTEPEPAEYGLQEDALGSDLFEEPISGDSEVHLDAEVTEPEPAEYGLQEDALGSDLFEEPINTDAEDIEITSEENSSEAVIGDFLGEINDINSDSSSDELVFEYNDDYDNGNSSSFASDDYSNSSANVTSSGKPIISPVGHTPISQATDLISIENIKLGNIPPLETHKSLLDNIDIGEIDAIKADLTDMDVNDKEAKVNWGSEEPTSDDYVEEMPEEIVKKVVVDETTSDDFVEEMPKEIVKSEVVDEPTSDDFVQEMPNEVVKNEVVNDLTSDDFVQEMPDEVSNNVSPNINIASEKIETPVEKDTLQDEADIFEDIPPIPGIDIDESPKDSEVTEEFTDTEAQIGLDDLGAIESFDVSDTSEDNIENTTNDDERGFFEGDSEESDIGLLYNGDPQEINEDSLEDDLPEDYDFKPKRKIGWMPICTIFAGVIILALVVGLLVKNKNNIDETYVQSSSDNLASPETDNADILESDELLEPIIPSDLEDVSPSAPAPSLTKSIDTAKSSAKTEENETVSNEPAVTKEEKQEIIKNAKAEIKKQQEQLVAPAPKTPLNASKTVTLKKLSWEVPDYLSYSDNIRKYLQSAGKSIKLTLSSDLLLTNEYIYSNRVKVDIKLSNDGDIKDAKIAASSGSPQVDKIVLQTVKDTLNVVKPQRGEVPTPEYKLGLIIYL